MAPKEEHRNQTQPLKWPRDTLQKLENRIGNGNNKETRTRCRQATGAFAMQTWPGPSPRGPWPGLRQPLHPGRPNPTAPQESCRKIHSKGFFVWAYVAVRHGAECDLCFLRHGVPAVCRLYTSSMPQTRVKEERTVAVRVGVRVISRINLSAYPSIAVCSERFLIRMISQILRYPDKRT